MANDYYTPTDIVAGSRARSSELDTNFNAVKVGFDLLPSKANLLGSTSYYAVDTGVADAYQLSIPNAPTSYADGLLVEFRVGAGNTNTGACTLTPTPLLGGDLGTKDVKDHAGNDPAAGDLPAGSVVRVRYNSTAGHFRSVGPFPGAAAAPSTASQSQAEDGTDATKLSFTPQRVHQAAKDAVPVVLPWTVGDETTTITTGTAKLTFRMPFAMTLTEVRASLATASTSGAVTVDINEGGTTILSTKLTIDQDGKSSEDAGTPAVISDTTLADDAEITIDIDGDGTGAKGLKVTLIGYKTTT